MKLFLFIILIPLIAQLYGFKSLGAISGLVVLAYNIGGAVSPPLAGAIFDSHGSYQLAFIYCGILGIAGSLIVWFLKPGKLNQS